MSTTSRRGLAELDAARECFEATTANLDILLSMLAGLDALFDDWVAFHRRRPVSVGR
jgi:hypothetical protein